ncbi:heme peroxidase [Desarmillaria ectypa]|nr:heme peroxidase [Desarmillaria ectypa]
MLIDIFTRKIVFKDLPHPPSSYLASGTPFAPLTPFDANYVARSADGSNYNFHFPAMGKAGTPYTCTVPGLHTIPATSLPDASLVFDTLLRRDKFEEHPDGISSLFFTFTDLVIHDLFNTDRNNFNINKTSSYLDLSILYGSSQVTIDQVRRKDGTGRLWEDVFADWRLLHMPPSSCALLVLLCRNHTFLLDRHLYTVHRQEGPLDYVGAILGLVRYGHYWRLDPLKEIRRLNHILSPRGEGNANSVEFNLLYRWHATLSRKDTQWTEDHLRKHGLGGRVRENEVIPQDFETVPIIHPPPDDIRQWTFGGLSRGSDGRFKDDDLAKLIQGATADRAGAFKARGIPGALKWVEVMGIEQARSWGTCSLNEFRRFMRLTPYANFQQWNPNEEIAVGLQAEETKKPGPGAGLCPWYTISQAILADAVSLIHRDRFLTVDFTPFNLTTFGYLDCQLDKDDGSYGGLLAELLFRALPDNYPIGSAYTHFPFIDPKHLRTNSRLSPDVIAKYDWNRPNAAALSIVVHSYADVEQVLGIEDLEGENRLQRLMRGHAPDRSLVSCFISADKWVTYFTQTTKSLIKQKNLGQEMKSIDIVRDVINVLLVKWICQDHSSMQYVYLIYFRNYPDKEYPQVVPQIVHEILSLPKITRAGKFNR